MKNDGPYVEERFNCYYDLGSWAKGNKWSNSKHKFDPDLIWFNFAWRSCDLTSMWGVWVTISIGVVKGYLCLSYSTVMELNVIMNKEAVIAVYTIVFGVIKIMEVKEITETVCIWSS